MSTEKNCPQCDAALPPTALYCRSCNFNILTAPSDGERIKCPKCSHFFVSGLICPKCHFTFEGGQRTEEGTANRQRQLNTQSQPENRGNSWGIALRVAVLLMIISLGLGVIGWVVVNLSLMV